MRALMAELPSLRQVIVAYGETPAGCLSMRKMIAEASDAPVAGEFSASDPCLLCFTSGTSASPKGVMRTSETITANGRTTARPSGSPPTTG
jgi:acyl-coenzyme A synthetase/AMP-(fatty) acid ligase